MVVAVAEVFLEVVQVEAPAGAGAGAVVPAAAEGEVGHRGYRHFLCSFAG